MKTKLFTRNIALGLLMALVLALGVQSTADAQVTLTRGKDHQVNRENGSIEFSFTVGGVPTSRGATVSDRDIITITTSGAPTGTSIAEVRYGSVRRPASATFTLTEWYTGDVDSTLDPNTQNNQGRLTNTTYYVKYDFGDASGTFTVDVAVTGGPSLTFTGYVVEQPSDVTNFRFASTNPTFDIGDPNPTNNYLFDETVTVTLDSAPWAYVDFQILHGSGVLYEDLDGNSRPDPGKSPGRTVQTFTKGSSEASVRLQMRRGTNIIRASIRDTNHNISGTTHDITYFYNGITLRKFSGEDQAANASTQLAEPLVVEVRDWYTSSTSGTAIRDQRIVFTTTGGTGFNPHPDYPDLDGTVTSPNTTVTVKTDTSGQAKVYAVLGTGASDFIATLDNNPDPDDNDAATSPDPSETFSFTPRTAGDPADIEKVSGDGQTGVALNRAAPEPLVVIVRDTYSLPSEGVTVTFATDSGVLLDPLTEDPGGTTEGTARAKTVMTDNSGRASVRYNVGNTSGPKTVRATISTVNKQVIFNINGTASPRNQNQNQNQQSTDRITITLSETRGEPGDEILVEVDSSPRGVLVNIDSGEFADAAFSRLSGGTPFTSTLTLPAAADSYTFSARRSGFTSDSATVTVETETTETQAGLSIDVTGTGTTRTVTITATNAQGGEVPGLDVTLRGSALIGGARTVRVDTPTNITVTNGTLQAAANGFATVTETITVTAGGTGGGTARDTSGTGTLTVTKDGAQVGTQQTLLVTASPTPSSNVDFTVTRGGATVGSGTILTTGSGRGIATVPTTGLYVLTVSAPGYAPEQVSFTAGGQTSTPDEPDEPAPTAGDPSRLSIVGLSTHTGTVNEPLDQQLSVQVVDANGIGVENVRVVFRVRTGQGRLSTRGNGRAIAMATDSQGYARAAYTPLSESSTVGANANGVSVGVTFTITTGSTPPADTTPRTGDTTPPPSPTVRPVLNASVDASSRSPMLWISDGKIYALVGSAVKEFTQGVENAMTLAIGGEKVYWTEKTGETRGTLKSANLDGTDAKLLRNEPIWGVPVGIAVDVAGSKLYWVDAANRLQRSNLDGSGIQNVLRNLSDPKDLALANGNAYWTQGNGHVRFVNLTGQPRSIVNISTGTDSAGSLTIAGGKVYWTEQIDGTYGTLNSANLDGTGATQLQDDALWGAPVGIAVDTARSRLYWTDGAGRLQRSNLDGSGIHNVVKGLGTPGDMVLSNSITVPAETPSTTTTTTTTTASKYDVNGDDTVDSKDVDAILVALAAGSTDTKYDVDGSGNVDIFDLIDLRGKVNAAASAPTLLGMKLGSVAVERLQEQIDLLVASGDRSPEALKTLIYLQQLIVMARPEKTQLLANYPNPFNPETWIPYELATDTDVRITIYNAQGVVIRTLQLGQQSAGYYTDRERAAYWDGKNALGEQVASGIYFYQLQTDEMSTLRKMVILK